MQQSALGDFSGKFGLLVVHSKILAEYKKLGLLNYNKYVITNVLQKEVSLPTINGLVVVENDRGTDDGTNYNSFLLGQGSVLTADPKVITPDYTEYDAAKQAAPISCTITAPSSCTRTASPLTAIRSTSPPRRMTSSPTRQTGR